MDNAEQIEFWNGRGADRWVGYQEELDRALEPFGHAVLDAARARAGERVVDVGCGCGWTTMALAGAVGPAGAVLGVDVSVPMLALAERRARARGLDHVIFTVADASLHAFAPEADLLLSRFGVMFFRDPGAAFTNLRKAIRPGGRLAFVCWGSRSDNPWFTVPMLAAGTVVPLPDASGPDDPGPFAFADRARVERILDVAGFIEVAITRSSPDFVLGAELDASATAAIESGPVSRVLVGVDDATRARVHRAVRAAIAPNLGPRGVVFPAATWIVQARSR